MMSVAAGPDPPLYGTWTIFSPAISANTSMARRFWLPAPCEAKLTLFGPLLHVGDQLLDVLRREFRTDHQQRRRVR